MPWESTWDWDLSIEPETMLQYAKMKKQECKDQWLCFRKWGLSVLRLEESQIQRELTRLAREAESWQEEIDYLKEERYKPSPIPPRDFKKQLTLF